MARTSSGLSAQTAKMYNRGIPVSEIPDLNMWLACPMEGYPKEWFFRKEALTEEFRKNVLPFIDLKYSFHIACQRFFKRMAQDVGFEKDEYRVITSLGGDAVMGETSLHTPVFYIRIGEGIAPDWIHAAWGTHLGRTYKMSKREYRDDHGNTLKRSDVIPRYNVLFRHCNGLDDMMGSQNRWCDVAYLIKLHRRWHFKQSVKEIRKLKQAGEL